MIIALQKAAAIGLILATTCLHRVVSAQQPENDLAFRRAAILTRGVNVSGWFGGWGDYSTYAFHSTPCCWNKAV